MRRIAIWVACLGLLGVGARAETECPTCGVFDPYAKLSPVEQQAKFDGHLRAASAAYAEVFKAARAGRLPAAKEASRRFVEAWAPVLGGFRMRPPRSLAKQAAWAKWIPVADERFAEGAQLILSADDLAGGRRLLESGRWALARLREENGVPSLPDLALRARQASAELHQAVRAGRPAAAKAASARVRDVAAALGRRAGVPPEAAAWRAQAASARQPAAKSAAELAAAAERLVSALGDRLD